MKAHLFDNLLSSSFLPMRFFWSSKGLASGDNTFNFLQGGSFQSYYLRKMTSSRVERKILYKLPKRGFSFNKLPLEVYEYFRARLYQKYLLSKQLLGAMQACINTDRNNKGRVQDICPKNTFFKEAGVFTKGLEKYSEIVF